MLTLIELSSIDSVRLYLTLMEHQEYVYSQMFGVLSKATKFKWNGFSFVIGAKPNNAIVVTITSGEVIDHKNFYIGSIDIIKIL